MEWKEWMGKRIFVQLKSGGVYTGKVISVDVSKNLTWFTIIDKFNKKVTFLDTEIIKIVEEDSIEMKGGEEE